MYLEGNPRLPRAHEFDIRSGSGKRGFGHCDTLKGPPVFVVDTLSFP